MKITVKLTPKASRNEIKGWAEGANGEKILKVSVTAVPEKGKANEALVELLVRQFNLPKGNFSIIRGETDKIKTIEIKGFNQAHMDRINNMKN